MDWGVRTFAPGAATIIELNLNKFYLKMHFFLEYKLRRNQHTRAMYRMSKGAFVSNQSLFATKSELSGIQSLNALFSSLTEQIVVIFAASIITNVTTF